MHRVARRLPTIMVMGMMVACVSGTPHTDSYTDTTGKTTLIESDRAQCARSCNDEYTRCMETGAARTNPVDGAPAGMFGASADCRVTLKTCLSDCHSR